MVSIVYRNRCTKVGLLRAMLVYRSLLYSVVECALNVRVQCLGSLRISRPCHGLHRTGINQGNPPRPLVSSLGLQSRDLDEKCIVSNCGDEGEPKEESLHLIWRVFLISPFRHTRN